MEMGPKYESTWGGGGKQMEVETKLGSLTRIKISVNANRHKDGRNRGGKERREKRTDR